jgi:hypothetical protein
MPSGELQKVIMKKNMLYEREIHSYTMLIAQAEKIVSIKTLNDKHNNHLFCLEKHWII